MGRGGVSAAVRPGFGLRLSGVRLHVDQIRKNQAGKCPAYARSAKREALVFRDSPICARVVVRDREGLEVLVAPASHAGPRRRRRLR